MFCTACGKEIPNDARFCSHCGTTQAAGSNASLPPPRKRGKLWNLHTFNWEGTCPTCRTPHTSENARCPNDGSPLVVAFNNWKRNPFGFAMHTAHLRCYGNCGYAANSIPCTRDSSVISNVNIKFRSPLLQYLMHTLFYVIFNVPAFVAIFFFVQHLQRINGQSGGIQLDSTLFGPLFFVFILCAATWGRCFQHWWFFRRTFNFDVTARAAMEKRQRELKGES